MQNPLILADYQNPIVEETATRLTVHFHNYVDRNIQLPNAMFPWKCEAVFETVE